MTFECRKTSHLCVMVASLGLARMALGQGGQGPVTPGPCDVVRKLNFVNVGSGMGSPLVSGFINWDFTKSGWTSVHIVLPAGGVSSGNPLTDPVHISTTSVSGSHNSDTYSIDFVLPFSPPFTPTTVANIVPDPPGTATADLQSWLSIDDGNSVSTIAIKTGSLVPESTPCFTVAAISGAVVCRTGRATFTVMPPSACPYGYQWQFQGGPAGVSVWTNLVDGRNSAAIGGGFLFNASGSHSTSLVVDHGVTAWDVSATPYQFRCVVSNGCATAGISSNAAMLRVCAVDFNCDGAVDFFDYDEFVTAFEAGTPSADFNGDGAIDFFDYDDFVAAFEAGC